MLSRLHPWLQHWSAAWARLPAVLPTLLPSCCALCGQHGDSTLCALCQERFCHLRPIRCLQCARPLPAAGAPDGARCGVCLLQPPAFDATIAATDYVPPFDQLVLALKFGNQLALAALFARMLRDALLQTSQSALPDVLCAMPLSPQRLAERGFNQALEVAKPLARALGIPLAPTLVARVRDTRAQAMLRTEERQRNVRNVFALSPQAQQHLQGRHIGVVDDVITTGATLNELAAVLKRHGAARVTNFVFARTPDHRPTPP